MNSIKVMVISNIEWSDQNAFGNTVSNWLEGMELITTSNIYRRSALPDNKVCKSYYSISTQSIIKNFFHPQNIGHEFHISDDEPKQPTRGNNERKLINLIHKYNFDFVYKFDDFLFSTKKWDNKRFKDYVQKESPDIVFSFLTESSQFEMLLNAVDKYAPSCKHVFFIADDVYNAANHKGRDVFRRLVTHADRVYGASDLLCQSYQAEFGVSISPLYKGCRFREIRGSKSDKTIELVYAGNLYYGRDYTLAETISAIKKYNEGHERKIHLNIFSGTPVSGKYDALFNDGVHSTFHGQRPFAEIQEALSSASVVLHAESFDEKWKQIVRYSYSTKIVDCLECGSVLMVIGPSGIASVEETRNIPGVFVVDQEENIYNSFLEMSESDLDRNARLTRAYAEKNRSIKAIQDQLYRDFSVLCEDK